MSTLVDTGDAAGRPERFSPAQLLASAISTATLPRLLALALALRLLALAIVTPIHSDEVFSYLEPAHRLLFGQGVVTWEWRAGVRGWMLPLAASGPMALGAWLAPGGWLYLVLPKLAMTLVSLVTVVFAWRLGERVSRLHGQVAGLAAAIWCEFILFAPHVISDTAAVALMLPAILILTDRGAWTPRRLALAGALISAGLSIRFQLAPAAATLAVAACGRRLREAWAPLLAGALAGLVPSAVCDVAMGGAPYAWVAQNVRINFVEHRAADWAASGPLGYLAEAWPRLGFWIAPLVVMAALGARRFPAIGWTALVNLAFHSAVAHKEYRYILLSVVLAVVLAAIGAVDWAQTPTPGQDEASGRRRVGLVVMTLILASVGCAVGGYRTEWTKWAPALDLEASLRADPALCGLALYRYDFGYTGGYTWLHRATPLYYFIDQDTGQPWTDIVSSQPVANVILARTLFDSEIPRAYRPLRCEGAGAMRVCLYERPGGCSKAPSPFAIQSVLRRLDQ